MRLYPEWVCELRGRDATFFIEQLATRIDRGSPHAVLEIGGGDGYIAGLVHNAGFSIRSTDPRPREPLHYPVDVMKASRLPFEDDSFDAIVSSNVLEHIEDLPASFEEMRRVLRPGGFMIHSMPRPVCSLITTLGAPLEYLRTWYFLLTGRLLRSRDFARPLPERIPFAAWINRRPRLASTCYKLLYAGWQLLPLRIFRIGYGHGTARGPSAELINWRESRWRTRFADADLEVIAVHHGDMSFSMNKLFPFRCMRLRSWLARRNWASIAFFIVEPAGATTARP